jgi:hypothetical protein
MPKVVIELQHYATVVGAVFFGAVVAYFTQQNPGSVIVALSHWNTAEPILVGGVMAGLVAVAGWLQKSILVPAPPAPPSGGQPVPIEAKLVELKVPPAPAARNERRRMRWVPVIALAGIAACTTAELQKVSTVTNASGEVCEIVVQATDPALAPLCATAVAVTNAILALGQQYAVAISTDAGASDAGPTVGFSGVVTNDALYGYLAAHGTKTVNEK